VLILEPECTGQRLYDEVAALLADEQLRADMADALKSLVRTDSTEAICRIVEELAQR
jgi:UDP-N-acetylglucosamine:LPS N-acetylglucosamine transferase